jgi:hypothetical protein
MGEKQPIAGVDDASTCLIGLDHQALPVEGDEPEVDPIQDRLGAGDIGPGAHQAPVNRRSTRKCRIVAFSRDPIWSPALGDTTAGARLARRRIDKLLKVVVLQQRRLTLSQFVRHQWKPVNCYNKIQQVMRGFQEC